LHTDPTPEPPTTALGDWHANLIHISRIQLILFVNDVSRLAVITPARKSHQLGNHLMHGLNDLLIALHIPLQWIQPEIADMQNFRISKSRSRSVLGTMNEYKFHMEYFSGPWSNNAMTALGENLSNMLVGPPPYIKPYEIALKLLQKRYEPAEI
jgi:hypothetical protein